MTITPQIVANQIPQEIRDLVIAVTGDINVNFDDPELKNFMPPDSIVQAILAAAGLDDAPSTAELDQANAWIKDQQTWITRSIKAFDDLNRIEPLTPELAADGKFPEWFNSKWSRTLNQQWSTNLQAAVEQAETYIKERDTK